MFLISKLKPQMREGLLHCERLLFYSLILVEDYFRKILIQLNIFDFFQNYQKADNFEKITDV